MSRTIPIPADLVKVVLKSVDPVDYLSRGRSDHDRVVTVLNRFPLEDLTLSGLREALREEAQFYSSLAAHLEPLAEAERLVQNPLPGNGKLKIKLKEEPPGSGEGQNHDPDCERPKPKPAPDFSGVTMEPADIVTIVVESAEGAEETDIAEARRIDVRIVEAILERFRAERNKMAREAKRNQQAYAVLKQELLTRLTDMLTPHTRRIALAEVLGDT